MLFRRIICTWSTASRQDCRDGKHDYQGTQKDGPKQRCEAATFGIRQCGGEEKQKSNERRDGIQCDRVTGPLIRTAAHREEQNRREREQGYDWPSANGLPVECEQHNKGTGGTRGDRPCEYDARDETNGHDLGQPSKFCLTHFRKTARPALDSGSSYCLWWGLAR